MFESFPPNPQALIEYSWQDYEPYYRDLLARPLDSSTVPGFLTDWTKLAEAMDETYSRLHVAITVNTADQRAEERYNNFLDTIYPKAEEFEQELKKKLLDAGLEPAGFSSALRKMRTEAEIFREINIPLFTQEHKLATKYNKIIGAQTVEWEGKEVTVTQLRPIQQETDRALREKAWRLCAERQLKDRANIGALWSEFMELRLKMASNAGFNDYRSFRWKQMLRFDYTPKDCVSFHKAIEETVVPAATRIYEKRKKLLGVPTLRPWDLEVNAEGKTALTPFKSISELIGGVGNMFRSLDGTLYSYFQTMESEGLLDLDNRKNKAPGGYCTEFPSTKRPFIFMNAVGLQDDVQTLLHESGHAFHAFESNRLPYYQQRHVGMEFAEVASMAMELLASPHLAASDGGFYTKEDAARARIEHLTRSIVFWPYMAHVDAFQHWVYENPEDSVKPENCDREWKRLSDRFMPWFDWTGLEEVLETGWQRKLHIHVVPFYYVEYGLAQLGAVQIWRNSFEDAAAAIESYRHALSLGGAVSLPELFSAAGARFGFDSTTLSSAVNFMESIIQQLEKD